MIADIARDVRHATRRLRLSPVYTVTTVATLAFGIALNTVLFSLANVVLFRDQPVAEPDQLVHIGWSSPASPERTSAVTWSEFLEISARDDVFSGVIAYKTFLRALRIGDAGSIVVMGELVSGGYFDVLGVAARRGRLLTAADEGAGAPAPVAVISDGLWSTAFASREDAIGSVVHLNGHPFTVVGVAAPGFNGLMMPMVVQEDLGVPVVAGRVFTDTDREGSPRVAVVSSSLARRLAGAPGQAVGQSVVLPLEADDIVHEVIGVVGDTKRRVIRDGSDQVYLPFDQRPQSDVSVVARMPPSSGSATDPLLRLIRTVDPEVAVIETMAITDVFARYFYPFRVSAFVLACLGLGAVAIAGLGVYGVIAFSASLRTREMGIRAALGATRADIVRLVLREAAGIAAVGLGMGLALSVPAGTLAAHVVWGLAIADPWVWATVVLFVGGMSLIAAFLPARRAARVDPATALRLP